MESKNKWFERKIENCILIHRFGVENEVWREKRVCGIKFYDFCSVCSQTTEHSFFGRSSRDPSGRTYVHMYIWHNMHISRNNGDELSMSHQSIWRMDWITYSYTSNNEINRETVNILCESSWALSSILSPGTVYERRIEAIKHKKTFLFSNILIGFCV